MSDERKGDKELKDEELDKVSGGVHEDEGHIGHHNVESGVHKDWSGEGHKHNIESGTHSQ